MKTGSARLAVGAVLHGLRHDHERQEVSTHGDAYFLLADLQRLNISDSDALKRPGKDCKELQEHLLVIQSIYLHTHLCRV